MAKRAKRKPASKRAALARGDGLVTVATFSLPLEAQLGRARLSSHGIRAFVTDEHLSTMNPQYMAVAGGIRLQVRARDAVAAEEILSEPVPPDYEEEHIEDGPPCPSCGKRYANEGRPKWLTFFCLLLLGLPFLFVKKRWICGQCGHNWSSSDKGAARAHPYRAARAAAQIKR